MLSETICTLKTNQCIENFLFLSNILTCNLAGCTKNKHDSPQTICTTAESENQAPTNR